MLCVGSTLNRRLRGSGSGPSTRGLPAPQVMPQWSHGQNCFVSSCLTQAVLLRGGPGLPGCRCHHPQPLPPAVLFSGIGVSEWTQEWGLGRRGGGAGALAAWKRVAHTVRGGGCAVFWNAIPKKRGRGDMPSAFRLRLRAPLFHRAKQMKTTHSWLFSSVPLASGPAEMSDSG